MDYDLAETTEGQRRLHIEWIDDANTRARRILQPESKSIILLHTVLHAIIGRRPITLHERHLTAIVPPALTQTLDKAMTRP